MNRRTFGSRLLGLLACAVGLRFRHDTAIGSADAVRHYRVITYKGVPLVYDQSCPPTTATIEGINRATFKFWQGEILSSKARKRAPAAFNLEAAKIDALAKAECGAIYRDGRA